MANIFSRLFNSQKKDYTYNGPRPVTSLSQVQGGPQYYQTILDRLAGRGVGYGSDYASLANPQIQQLHNQYTGYTLPKLKSELSATGRRAGSSGFQQIARSMSDQADKENAIIANLAQRNAEASHGDVNTALQNLGNYANNEANLVSNAANFEYGNIYAPQVARDQQRMDNESVRLNRLGQAGVSLALAPFTGGTSLSALPTTFGGQQYAQDPYTQILQKLLNRNQTNTTANAGQVGGIK